MQPTNNTNWFQPQQGNGILSQLGAHLPDIGSLAAVALAPEASLPALAIRGALGGAAGSVGGRMMGANTPGIVDSAMKGLETGGELGVLNGGLNAGNAALKPILDSLGNNTNKIANSGLADVVNMMKDMGVKPTPEIMSQMGGTASNFYDSLINNALANSGPVDLNATMEKFGSLLSPKTQAQATLADVLKRNDILTPTSLDPYSNLNGQQVRKALSDLYSEKEQLRPAFSQLTGMVDPEARRNYNELSDYYNAIKDSLYNRPEVQLALKSQVEGLTPEALMSPEYYGGGELGHGMAAKFAANPQLAQYIAQTASQAGQGDDQIHNDLLRNYSQFINMGKLGSNGVKVKENVYPFKAPQTHNPFSNNGVLGLLALNLMNRGAE